MFGEKEKKQESKKEIILTLCQKMQLKELGLTHLGKNQVEAAESWFKVIGLTAEEIESLKTLNFFGIEREKKKIKEELERMEAEEKKEEE